ncbi:ketoisovalerate oxidoreductase [candidate division WS5 bacterium]|uniref:Ketoisovalerate oxidoreductase n=1 Tax=candidate division WS5 bacterium TaxID=2093353 RepID=A0A419DG04_9BACT|nr:MAG: ketoisovalerate oxidoreductase [candidate division WS5 bacterium]
MKELKRILISGEGGQGIQILSKALVEAAYLSGKKISYVPNYGVEQRGGVSLGFIQISNQEIGFPKFHGADILVILAERAVPRVGEYITKDTLIIYDKTLVREGLLEHFPNQKIAISAYETAEKKMIAKVFNMIVLGFLAHMVGGVSPENLKTIVNETLSTKYEKNPELQHFNERALEMGMSGISYTDSKKKEEVAL